MYKYLSSSTERFAILISRVTDSINEAYKKNIKLNGVNSSTKFVTYNTTKPNDYKENYSSIPGKNDSKLLKFYY